MSKSKMDSGVQKNRRPELKKTIGPSLAIAFGVGYSSFGLWFAPGWANGWPIGPPRRDLYAFVVCTAWTIALAALGIPISAYLGQLIDQPEESPKRSRIVFTICFAACTCFAAMIAFSQYSTLHSIVGWPK